MLGHAIGLKQDAVLDLKRLVLGSLVHVALDKDKDAVASAHLDVVEFGALLAIDVEEEVSLSLAGHTDVRNLNLLLAAVVNQKLLGGSALQGDHRVKRHGVGRELEQVAWRGGKVVVDAAGAQQRQCHECDEKI